MSRNQKIISVLGCGWLGLPLAEKLKSEGYRMKGSTTTASKMKQMEQKGIQPYFIRLNPSINEDYDPSFFECETLILNIPPSRKQPDISEFYPAQIEEIIRLGENIKKVLFISSTSVYPNLNREVHEKDAGGSLSNSGQALLKAEEILKSQRNFKVTTLRFCGLYNAERNPGRFLAGRKLSMNGRDKVNLIHLEDCIHIIFEILKNEMWEETFNACADAHPEKQEFYSLATQKLGLEPPAFDENTDSSYKIISSEKLKKHLNYNFRHPDPYDSVKRT